MTTTITVSRVLAFIACIVFAVGFGVFVWGDPGPKFFAEDVLLGLAFLAGAHSAP